MNVDLPPVTYLAMDSLQEGVGASQILPYVEALASKGIDVRLQTFEKAFPPDELRRRLASAGVRWEGHPFGGYGSLHGLMRVARASRWLRGADLVHARSDLAAASALVGRPKRWLWDVRSLFADQRIALRALRRGSPQDRVLRQLERTAAARSDAIVTLTQAVVDVLADRYGDHIRDKTTVIPTCVDLERFPSGPLPTEGPFRLLLAGTLNLFYDVGTMVRFWERLRREASSILKVLTPPGGPFEKFLESAGADFDYVAPAEMPTQIVGAHAGLSVCRTDAGVSLKGAMPTKIGEFLACGRPVIVNRGLGDMDDLLAAHGAGVVLEGTDDEALDTGVQHLLELLRDPNTPTNCRALAAQHFSLDQGVDRLLAAYRGALGA